MITLYNFKTRYIPGNSHEPSYIDVKAGDLSHSYHKYRPAHLNPDTPHFEAVWDLIKKHPWPLALVDTTDLPDGDTVFHFGLTKKLRRVYWISDGDDQMLSFDKSRWRTKAAKAFTHLQMSSNPDTPEECFDPRRPHW